MGVSIRGLPSASPSEGSARARARFLSLSHTHKRTCARALSLTHTNADAQVRCGTGRAWWWVSAVAKRARARALSLSHTHKRTCARSLTHSHKRWRSSSLRDRLSVAVGVCCGKTARIPPPPRIVSTPDFSFPSRWQQHGRQHQRVAVREPERRLVEMATLGS
jgi:hypothetical protein